MASILIRLRQFTLVVDAQLRGSLENIIELEDLLGRWALIWIDFQHASDYIGQMLRVIVANLCKFTS